MLRLRTLLPLAALLLVACAALLQTAGAKSSEPQTCSSRFLLFSVQRGEGFSLRRDALVRVAATIMMGQNASTGAGTSSTPWTLVLPPLSSRISPHWYNGLPHSGVAYTERTVPYASLWDMEHLAEHTGVRFMEYAEYVAMQQEETSQGGGAAGASALPIGDVDQVLHLCSFSYTPAFFEAQSLAGQGGRPPAHPGSSFPRSHLLREFACMDGEEPERGVGYCSTPMPHIDHSGEHTRILDTEYGALRLPRGGKAAVHCGLANLMPSVLPSILEEFVSPTKSYGGQPVCSLLLSNTQLVFWNPTPHAYTPADDPAALSHAARERMVRSMRLSPHLLALAHTFIEHALKASAVRPLNASEGDAAALSLMGPSPDAIEPIVPSSTPLPPYLSFHVRRADFKFVHRADVPELPHLALQIVRKFRTEWEARKLKAAEQVREAMEAVAAVGQEEGQGKSEPGDEDDTDAPTPETSIAASTAAAIASGIAPPLSSRVFLASDMDRDEFSELSRLVAEAQHEGKGAHAAWPVITLVRFDVGRVRAELHEQLSAGMHAFLQKATAAATVSPTPHSLHPSSPAPRVGAAVPLTPFHVLLIDHLLLEQSAAGVGGFTGTRNSFVSELVWLHRRAWGVEQERASGQKDVLEGGAAPEGASTMPTPKAATGEVEADADVTAPTVRASDDQASAPAAASPASPASPATPAAPVPPVSPAPDVISVPVPAHPSAGGDVPLHATGSYAYSTPRSDRVPPTDSSSADAAATARPVKAAKTSKNAAKGKGKGKPKRKAKDAKASKAPPVRVRTGARKDKDEL